MGAMEKDKECVSYAFLPVAIIKTLTVCSVGEERAGVAHISISEGDQDMSSGRNLEK